MNPARRTPAVIERTVDLPHSQHEVFAAVMSPEIAPLIDPAVREWRPDRRPIGVGTRFSIRGKFQWLPIRATSIVTEWEPPSCATFEAVKPRWPTRLEATHRFAPSALGTSYTWTSTIHRRGPIGALAARLVARLLDRTIADQQRTLAAWLASNAGEVRSAEL